MRKRFSSGRPLWARLLLPLLLTAVLLLTGCAAEAPAPALPTPDPHAGQVLVPNGSGGEYWVTEYEALPVSALDRTAFVQDGAYLNYLGTDAVALRGVDVSEHQGEIDWEAAAADGLDFAIVRAGYRGWTEGALYEDEYFRRNAEGALNAGLRLGAYFFSQATTPEEAREEARMLLELTADYDVTLPLCYDWENIGQADARTEGMTGEAVTDCALAFAQELAAAGRACAVYFYRDLGYRFYELDRLAGLPFWAGAAGSAPDFYYAHEIWQYSFTGRVSGIEGDCDLDLYFLPAQPETRED